MNLSVRGAFKSVCDFLSFFVVVLSFVLPLDDPSAEVIKCLEIIFFSFVGYYSITKVKRYVGNPNVSSRFSEHCHN